jgi:uncharacterized membrane protein
MAFCICEMSSGPRYCLKKEIINFRKSDKVHKTFAFRVKKLLISVVQLGAMLPVYQIVSKHIAVIF